ncbi:tetratricopeptide repeat protein [Desulfovibrio sp. Huiquan2017]|uniref:tetratricopeptide repeat protein n=1 Tax=Desulfovibrio sp. Huiquan2017 TaxID=2816861 RepID=UPI001A92FDDC
MPNIVKLLETLPVISQSRLVASGFGIWVVWKGDLHGAVDNTLQEYGALCVAKDGEQALWYCNTVEVFRAMARLQIWARVNPMPVFCQLVPLTFLVGYDLGYSVSLSVELDNQTVPAPDEFEVVIHPKLKGRIQSVSGLSTEPAPHVDGLANVEWLRLVADQGLDYESTLRWYFIIKPLGRMSDKESILGWRDFSTEVVELLQRLGLKYISDIKEGAIFLPLDNFRLLKSFTTEMMNLIRYTKEAQDKKYWPVIMAAVPQGDLHFTADLPRKVGLDWNRLTPDYPHVHFMDGFLLSPWFRMNEARYGAGPVALDSWCALSLKDGDEGKGYGTMQVALPNVLSGTDEGRECFYCGLKNHGVSECPSKKIATPQPQVWRLLAKADINEFSESFSGLDKDVSKDDFVSSIFKIMESRNDLESLLARAVFEINVPVQLRTLKLVWRSRAKEWGDGFKQLVPQEGEYIWGAMESLEKGDMDEAERLLKDAQIKYPRSYQPQSLWGYWYLEKGDTNQALFHWQEAERMSYTPLQQGCMAFLQARLMEVEGDYKDAINTYKRVNSLSPTWLQPIYRQAVCMIKMGFTGQAMDTLLDLVVRDPNIFNRVLVDPELDRGRVQLLSAMWEKWNEAESSVESMRKQVEVLTDDIAKRFDETHPFFETANEELDRLRNYGRTNNYVAYHRLLKGAQKFQDALNDEVRREIKRINANVEYLTHRVRDIQREAAWFPFPKLLREFNKEFNYCVDKINWIRTQRLQDADNFRKSLRFVGEIEEHIDSLQKRLVTLRIIRDFTLFILMLGRNFIWLELIGLGILLIAVPSLIYFTHGIEGNIILDTIKDPSQRWEISKGLVIILSVLSVSVAAVKSALTFDKRKRELFDQIDKDIRKAAPKRY